MKLRDYQLKAIEDLRGGFRSGHIRQILTLPTGAGKTVVAAAIASEAAAKGTLILSITDRLTLHTQAGNHFELVGLDVGIFQADNTNLNGRHQLINATAQTIAARIKRGAHFKQDIRDFDIGLIIIDEAHVIHESHRKVMDYFSAVPVVGLTATPSHKAIADYYTNLVRGPTIAQMIEAGNLVPFRIFAPTAQIDIKGVKLDSKGEFKTSDVHGRAVVITGDIILNWIAHGENRPTIAFCANIAHADELAQEFSEAGIVAEAIHSNVDADDRKELYRQFKAKEIQVLTSVDVLSIGFDEPMASCAILARPTSSTTIHVQQCGRVIRLHDGKVDALIFDHAGNCERHGLPQDYIPPELEDSAPTPQTAREITEKDKKTATCPKCQAVMKHQQRKCPACGFERHIRSEVIVAEGVLSEGAKPKEMTPPDRGQILREIMGLADEKGYQRGWAIHNYKEIFGKVPWEDGLNINVNADTGSLPSSLTKRLIHKKYRQKHAIQNAMAKKAKELDHAD